MQEYANQVKRVTRVLERPMSSEAFEEEPKRIKKETKKNQKEPKRTHV